MKKFYTIACSLALSLFVTSVFAQSPPQANQHHQHYNCSRQHGKQIGTNPNPSPAPGNEVTSSNTKSTKAGVTKMTFSNWYAYNGSALVAKLKSSTDYNKQLKPLYDFDQAYGQYIFSSRNVETVSRAMYNLSISHNGTYSSGMYGLVCYLHAATFHEFFKKSVSLDKNAMRWYTMACESFTNNAHLYDTTKESISILSEFLVMVDNDQIRHKPSVVRMMKKVMRNVAVYKNWKQITDLNVLSKYAAMVNRIYFYMFRGVQNSYVKDFINVAKTDYEFFDLLSKICTSDEIASVKQLKFLRDNGIGEMARAATAPELAPLVERHLAKISRLYNRLDVNWLKCIEALNKYCDCSKYGLCQDLKSLRKEINQKLFPNTWIFDDGKMIIKTSLSYKHVEPLYYAAKEVEAQMYRILQTDECVPNDPNKTLNMVVYGTLAEYKAYQTFLNNLSTENGGIYIESQSTFYTYERTAAESTYSLQELFRHEYTHYLQGRYIEQGFWGSTDFFKNSRLTWFEEGMAEFMAGSTSSDGIRFRNSMMNNLRNDGKNRMPVSETIGASYASGFTFYRYSYMIWLYMYHNQHSTMKQLMELIKANDIAGFDAKISTLKNSPSFQTNVNNFIDQSIKNTDQWWVPQTAYLPDNMLNIKSLSDIETEFKKITGLKNIKVTSDASSSISRFRIEGKLTTGKFDQELNSIIKKLNKDKYTNNFDFLVGYFKNVNGYNADFSITGSLKNRNSSDTPLCDFKIDTKIGLTGQQVILTSTSTGYIKKFNWKVENVKIEDPTSNETKVIFNNKGKYNITLEITDNNGKVYTKTLNNAVEIFDKTNTLYCTPKTNFSYSHISLVEIANMSKSNDIFNTNGYANFTNSAALLEIGKADMLTVVNDYTGKGVRTKAWIDWNQDGEFDKSEQVLNDISGDNPHVTTVIPPADATIGVTRMRVRFTLNKNLDSCEENSYIGETQDFTIIVKEKDNYVDNEKPSTPNNLAVTNISHNSAYISWAPSTDNVSVKEYMIYTNNVFTAKSSTNSYFLSNLNASTNYNISILAVDGKLNKSDKSTVISFKTAKFNDVIAPTIPTSLVANNISEHALELTWNESLDNISIKEYSVFMNNTKIASTPNTSYKISNLKQDTEYTFSIEASDDSNNISPRSNTITVKTVKELDKIAPSIPQNLRVVNTSETSIEIAWTESTDNIGIKEYIIYVNGILIKKTNTNSFIIDELSPDSNYEVMIKSVDLSYNESAFSEIINKRTEKSNETYCSVTANESLYEWIASVSMKGLDNRSDKQRYSDFTNMVSTVQAGSQAWITIGLGFIRGQSYTENVRVWIDWNKDKRFDQSEIVLDQTRNSTMGAWFDVPADFSGSTRMRIMLQHGNKPEACSNITSGETEDYTISTLQTKSGIQHNISKIPAKDAIVFKAYPNPCVDNINLEIPEKFNQGEITITNSLGAVVKQINIDYLRKQINLSDLKKGNYIIIIRKNNDVMSKQIIVL